MTNDEGREENVNEKAKEYADLFKNGAFVYLDEGKYNAFIAGWDDGQKSLREQLAIERRINQQFKLELAKYQDAIKSRDILQDELKDELHKEREFRQKLVDGILKLKNIPNGHIEELIIKHTAYNEVLKLIEEIPSGLVGGFT